MENNVCRFYCFGILFQVARCLSLKSIPELQNLCGGAAIEQLAVGGDPHAFPFTKTRTESSACDFSFSGVRSQAESFINSEREKEGNFNFKISYILQINGTGHSLLTSFQLCYSHVPKLQLTGKQTHNHKFLCIQKINTNMFVL